MVRTFEEIHGFYKENKKLIGPEDIFHSPSSISRPKQATKKVRKKVSRKCSRGSSFRNKDKEKPLSNTGKTSS